MSTVSALRSRLSASRPLNIALLFAPLGLLVLIIGLTPEPTRLGFAGDLIVYRGYGQQLLLGATPYLAYHVEYPPLALAPMVLPLLASPSGVLSDVDYVLRFTVIEGGLAVAAGWLVYRAAGRSRSALVLWAVLVALAWASFGLRYDLWAVLCTQIAVLVVLRRPGVAGVALGLGTMLKLYPLAVLPVLAAWAIAERDRGGLARLLAGWAGVVALIMGAAWAVAGPASLQWIIYQQQRGLQIESLGAGLLLALHLVAGQAVDVAIGFGSVQVQSAGSDLLVAASPLALATLLAVVVVVSLLRFRLDRDRLGRVQQSSVVLASVAATAAVLVTSKVLSVQYVIWLLPFAPLLSVPMRWLLLAITALSTIIYTVDYQGLMHLEAPMILALLARNAMLLVLAIWLLLQLYGGLDALVRDRRGARLLAIDDRRLDGPMA